MPNNKETTDIRNETNSNGKIHYSYIITAVVAFALGIVSILLLKNLANGSEINFSTLDIINLVFSTGISAASIALAITAIILSKKSEQVILDKNVEGIRYQNEIFANTLEVLSKIQTSTGVSEKRIEDIAHELKSVGQGKPGLESKEERYREILRNAFHAPGSVLTERKQRIDKQQQFTNEVMEGIGKISGVEVHKIGSGDFDESGDKMVDGIFGLSGKKYSASTFYSQTSAKIINFADVETYRQYFLNLASELGKGTFEKSFLIFNKNVENDQEFGRLVTGMLDVLDKKIAKKIILASGSTENIVKKIKRELID